MSFENQVLRVDQLELENQSRASFEKFLGGIAVESSLSSQNKNNLPETTSLHSKLIEAGNGNAQAIASVYANSKIAVIEAIYKRGHISEVKAEINSDGSVSQFGQTMMDINRNALQIFNRPNAYRKRLEAETLNSHRIESLIKAGLLEDNFLFIPSLYPDDMTNIEAKNYGFFAKTKTNILQTVSVSNGVYELESAFLEGDIYANDKTTLQIVSDIYKYFGYDVSNYTVTDILKTPLLIPKSVLPNGLIDLVAMFDKIKGNSFFGTKGEAVGNYNERKALSKKRESNLEQTTNEVVSELISSKTNSPLDAVNKLIDIVREKVVIRAIYDNSIESSSFGEKAEVFINRGRNMLTIGDQEGLRNAMEDAIDAAEVYMCGFGKSNNKNKERNPNDISANSDEETIDSKSGQIRCINCHKFVAKREVVKPKSWCCPKCKYEVDICSGKVLNGGIVESLMDKIDQVQKPEPKTEKEAA